MKYSTAFHPILAVLTLMAVLALWTLSACDDDATSTTRPDGSDVPGDTGDLPSDTPADLPPDLPPPDLTEVDANPDIPPPQPGEYGATCVTPSQCNSGLCVPNGEGQRVCSDYCNDVCAPFPGPIDAFCLGSESTAGVAFFCQVNLPILCAPCRIDLHCGSAGVCFTDGISGSCATPCEEDETCPHGYQCTSLPNQQGEDALFCVPESGSCHCNEDNAGSSRICYHTNEHGACMGIESCNLEFGWTGCSAEIPSAEICDGEDNNCNGLIDEGLEVGTCAITNEHGTCEGVEICGGEQGPICIGPQAEAETCDGVDNNCDGRIDEDFKDENGLWTRIEHCGGCFQSCIGRFGPTAANVACELDTLGEPQCVITACIDGFLPVGNNLCVPIVANLCLPCVNDADCSASPGSRCVTTTDSRGESFQICGRDCSSQSPFGTECPDLYTCSAIDVGESEPAHQCLPTSGSCYCTENTSGFTVPCQVEIVGEIDLDGNQGQVTCQGRQACVGTDFGVCELDVEVCDGLDNNCDGRIDTPFRRADGKYGVSQEHCGRCHNDCRNINIPNAISTCDLDADDPHCIWYCQDGYVDLINGRDDGCECQILSAVDFPDAGQVDANCDGIDGQIDVALFVSKTGSDSAAGTIDAPLATIGAALQAAASTSGIRDIYVSAGVYSESITLVEGVGLYGGYSLDFRTRNPEVYPTTIFGRAPTAQQPGAVNALELSQPTMVMGFNVFGPNTVQSGAPTYAVFIRNTGDALTLRHNRVTGGTGAPGVRGNPGTAGVNGTIGSAGINAIKTNVGRTCTGTAGGPRAGGNGGARTCAGVSVNGGKGGDALCPRSRTDNGAGLVADNCDTRNTNPALRDACLNICDTVDCHAGRLPPPQGVGLNGANNPSGFGLAGPPTYDTVTVNGSANQCQNSPGLPSIGFPGLDGADGTHGPGGATCTDPRGTINAQGLWQPSASAAGAPGAHGGGGGGGSAGRGYDINPTDSCSGDQCNDTIGASGGGGGAGGCGGTGGSAGSGGGASFAVYVTYTATMTTIPNLVDNVITTGRGGDGGAGGPGALGGIGGQGANGGTSSVFCGFPGGRGGNGGRGGAGGGGAGGCGGAAFGIFVNPGTNTFTIPDYLGQNTVQLSGTPGRGGAGGPSNGIPGAAGSDGTHEALFVRP